MCWFVSGVPQYTKQFVHVTEVVRTWGQGNAVPPTDTRVRAELAIVMHGDTAVATWSVNTRTPAHIDLRGFLVGDTLKLASSDVTQVLHSDADERIKLQYEFTLVRSGENLSGLLQLSSPQISGEITPRELRGTRKAN